MFELFEIFEQFAILLTLSILQINPEYNEDRGIYCRN